MRNEKYYLSDNEPLSDIEAFRKRGKKRLESLRLDQHTTADEPISDIQAFNAKCQERLKSLQLHESDSTTSSAPEEGCLTTAMIAKRKEKSRRSDFSQRQYTAEGISGVTSEAPIQTDGKSPYALAQKLMQKLVFRIVCGAIYWFNGIVYELLDNNTLDRIILKYLRHPIAAEGRPEIISAIRTFIRLEPDLVIDDPSIDPNYMVFINGRLDLRTMEFGPNDPSVFQTSYLNFEYDPNARYCPNFDAYIDSASDGDPEIKELMLQMHGYIASSSMEAKVFFLLIGEGDTGKSLTINFDTLMFTNDFVSTVELQALGDRFSSGNLVNMRINIGGDLPNKPITPDVVKHVKGITGNDRMTAEKKYIQPFSFKPTCKLIFATNHPLILQQQDEQFCERLVVVPFEHKIPKDKQDHDLLNKLRVELPAIFNRILSAYLRLCANNFEFKKIGALSDYLAVPSTEVIQALNIEEAITDFFDTYYEITDNPDDFVSIKQLYTEFNAYYCQQYKLSVNQDKFSKTFKQLYDNTDTNGLPRKFQGNSCGRGYQGIKHKG